MKKIFTKALLIFLAGVLATNFATSQESSLGDTLDSFNAGVITPTPDRMLQGVEFAQDHFWVTGSDPDDGFNQKLYKISQDGQTLVDYWEIGPDFTSFKDLAYDGEFLYATGTDTVYQINPATGQLTGVKIPGPEYYLNGLAYDPATGHFWVSGDGNLIYEVDPDGEVINSVSFPIDQPTAGLAWDTVSEAGPYLWVWSMKYTPSDVRPKAFQLNPENGELTDVSFEGVLMHPDAPDGADQAGGATISSTFIEGKTSFIGLHGSAFEDASDQLDWIVSYDLDPEGTGVPGPEISVDPQSIQNDLMPGDSVDIPITVSNASSDYSLNWQASLSYPGSNNPGEPGDSLLTFDATSLTPDNNTSLRGIAFAKGHFFVSGQTNIDDLFQLYKIKKDGSEVVETYNIGSLYTGWTSITSDGEYIYGAQQYQINKFDPDSGYIVDTYPRPNFSPSGMAYDPQQEHFYLGGSNGGIMKINKEGEELNFYVLDHDISGLTWDSWSPGGPYLWVYYSDNESGSMIAKRIEPESGNETGVSFNGISFAGDDSNPDSPLDISVTPAWQENKLVMAALQTGSTDSLNVNDYVAVYDLATTPAPGWIELLPQAYGTTQPEGESTFFVRLNAIMEDTLMTAELVISSNDVLQPQTVIPVNFNMMPALPTSAEEQTSGDNSLISNLYPNPAKNFVNLALGNFEAKAMVRVYDISGALVLEKRLNNKSQQQIQISSLPKGIYHISVETSKRKNTRKLVVY